MITEAMKLEVEKRYGRLFQPDDKVNLANFNEHGFAKLYALAETRFFFRKRRRFIFINQHLAYGLAKRKKR